MFPKTARVAGIVSCLLLGFPVAYGHDLVPLLERYQGAPVNDTLYTINFQDWNSAPGVDHGAAAWLPCAPGGTAGPHGEVPTTNVTNLGYTSDKPMMFTCAQPSGSLPLYRFHLGSPQTDHVLVTSTSEINTLYAGGYTFERVDGYIFTTQVTGSVPLYRLSRCLLVGSACDIEHRYTISADAKNTLVAAGWAFDTVAGYVFDGYNNATVQATYKGVYNDVSHASTSTSTISIRNTLPLTADQLAEGFGRNQQWGLHVLNATGRPANARQARLTFSLFTGDLFSGSNNFQHMPVFLYAHDQLGSDGLPTYPYDGLGIFFAVPNALSGFCGSSLTSGGQIFVEEYRGSKIKYDCATNLTTPMAANHSYDITLIVDDTAKLSLTVMDGATLVKSMSKSYASDYPCPITHAPGALPASLGYCDNPYSPDHFPVARTGFDIWQDTLASGTQGVGRIRNLTFRWLDVNGNPL